MRIRPAVRGGPGTTRALPASAGSGRDAVAGRYGLQRQEDRIRFPHDRGPVKEPTDNGARTTSGCGPQLHRHPIHACTFGSIDIVLAARRSLGNLHRLNGLLGCRTNGDLAVVSSTMWPAVGYNISSISARFRLVLRFAGFALRTGMHRAATPHAILRFPTT